MMTGALKSMRISRAEACKSVLLCPMCQVLDCFVHADQRLIARHDSVAKAKVIVHLESSVKVRGTDVCITPERSLDKAR